MKPIRVALSGSGFKFPAHVGALHAIRDAGYDPIGYAGTSGGSIVAALAASGMDLNEMKEMTLTKDWSSMLSWSIFSLPRLLLTKMGVCDGSNLLDFVSTETKEIKFSQLEKDLIIVATDMAGNGAYVFSKSVTPNQSVALACRASASIPFVYTPIQIGPAFLCDGGVANNIPVDLLPIDDVLTIGIHLTSAMPPLQAGTYGPATFIPRLIEILMDSSEAAHAAVAARTGALLASVDTSYASALDRNMPIDIRNRLFKDGYEATAVILKS